MAHDVFISNSSKDKAVADEVCATLESHGVRCWIAGRDIEPGQTWSEAIIDAIRASRAMVLIHSAHANTSRQVMREIERAAHRNIPIIPFRIEEIAPSKHLEYFISAPHWLDAFPPPIEPHIERLAKTMRRLLQAPAAPDAGGGASEVHAEATPAAPIDSHTLDAYRPSRPPAVRRPRRLMLLVSVLAILAAIGTWRVWHQQVVISDPKPPPTDPGKTKTKDDKSTTTTTATTSSVDKTDPPPPLPPPPPPASLVRLKAEAEVALDEMKEQYRGEFDDEVREARRLLREADEYFERADTYPEATERYRRVLAEQARLGNLRADRDGARKTVDAVKAFAATIEPGGSVVVEKFRSIGNQGLTLAQAKLQQRDFDGARATANAAWEQFKRAQDRVAAEAKLTKARQAYASASAGQDPKAVEYYAPREWSAVQGALSDARRAEQATDVDAAVAAYGRASSAFATAVRAAADKQFSDAARRDAEIQTLLAEAKANDNPDNAPRALAALEKLLKLNPKNREAADLRDKINAYPKRFANALGMKFLELKPGAFTMGTPSDERGRGGDEPLPFETRVSEPFMIGVHEVTRGQFAAFVKETGYKTDAEKAGWAFGVVNGSFDRVKLATWRQTGFAQADDHPVVNVSWNDATAFCEWLSRRDNRTYWLPSEVQWEYACRAGTTTAFPWGKEPNGGSGAPYANADWPDGFTFTAAVGSFKPNAWGIYDMIGNVWEWCSNEPVPYHPPRPEPPRAPPTADVARTPVQTPPGRGRFPNSKYVASADKDKPAAPAVVVRERPNPNARVFRGGAWYGDPFDCRSGSRHRELAEYCGANTGFRVVTVVTPTPAAQ